jgi:hypothetical protein
MYPGASDEDNATCIATLRPYEHIAVINNRYEIKDIANLNELPSRIRDEILSVDELRAQGFQEILGLKDCTIMLSCGGYWSDDKFVVTSYGSHNYQWDGQRLTSTIKVYV